MMFEIYLKYLKDLNQLIVNESSKLKRLKGKIKKKNMKSNLLKNELFKMNEFVTP